MPAMLHKFNTIPRE